MRRISRWATAAAVCLLLTTRAAAATDIGGIGDGGRRFRHHCAACHGANAIAGGTSIPNQRRSVLPYEGFEEVVRPGIREKLGIPRFGRRLAPFRRALSGR